MAQLEIRNVTRRFGDFVAVDNLSLSIEAGEFFTLLGPSGCGKTTTLRIIAGFDVPDAGQIIIDGKDVTDAPPEQRPVHTVFQSYALFPHMTVAQKKKGSGLALTHLPGGFTRPLPSPPPMGEGALVRRSSLGRHMACSYKTMTAPIATRRKPITTVLTALPTWLTMASWIPASQQSRWQLL